MNMAAEPTPSGIELNATPTGIKRLNKVPLIGGIALACVIVSLLGYAMYQRSIPIELEEGDNAQNLNGDTTTPGKLTGPYTGAEIEAYKPPTPTTITETSPAAAAAPKAAPPVAKEVDLLQQVRDRQRQKRLQMAYGALDAPSEVSFKEVTGNGESTAENAPLDPRAEILKAVLQKNGLGDQPAGNLDASFAQGVKKTPLLLGRDFPMSELLIRSGGIIPATLISGLNSDLPGEVIAQVSQNVYDTATGQILMIPQGTRLVGTYDNKVKYGQSRALVVWNRLVFPDASALELGKMNGNDMSGYAGFEDQVNNHYFRVFGTAALMSIISAGYAIATEDDENSDNENSAQTSVAREMAQTSDRILRKGLNIAPTIKIRPGYRFNVFVNKDIQFNTPYQG